MQALAPLTARGDTRKFGAVISQRNNAIVVYPPDAAAKQVELADECVGAADQTKTVQPGST